MDNSSTSTVAGPIPPLYPWFHLLTRKQLVRIAEECQSHCPRPNYVVGEDQPEEERAFGKPLITAQARCALEASRELSRRWMLKPQSRYVPDFEMEARWPSRK